MNPFLKILPLPLLLLLAAGTGLAPRALAASPAKDSIVMFIAHADVPPYYIGSPDLPDRGILPDVLKAVTGPLGYALSFRRLPDKRGWDMLEHGGVNVYASAREWKDEPDKFLWTAPFMPNDDVLLYRAGSSLQYIGPETLHGATVACIKGFVYPALEPHFGPGGITRLDATSPDVMLELLRRGRADAAIVNLTEIRWMFHNREDIDPRQFRMDPTPIGTAPIRFVFPKDRGWEPVIEQFNLRLREMKADGSLKAVLDRYK
ncbi:transporter substrate-binding domain-containing protein [Pseudodesulfovibrio thermohalotolerans]|uniref:substrate-binding periplasmic protein n=1 Tax=Pseudodesulfovibrio thermohalotolerans TaxID=2880651 RepID=UPI002441D173|nr:transporter substrate-binding domain-containing protein [Pseudodesulfovibrio thermohalotolerans]WFS62933.1 transporter substrate-binding domain-containing protein [Pseudodesulfovibrio thermohalotolerans]